MYDPGAMTTPTRSPVQELVGSLVGNLMYPWVFALLLVLFVADMLIPDPIPFADEIMLAILTFLVGTWRTRRKVSTDAVEVTRDPANDSPGPQR